MLGVPNAGKSTLVNLFCGRKVAGVSPRPQTTRRRILGVRTEPGCQMVFVDTPGYCQATNRMGIRMREGAVEAARESDVVLYVVDAGAPESGDAMRELLAQSRAPKLLALNKIDLLPKPALLPLLGRFNAMEKFEELVPVSALDADGTSLLLDLFRCRLPEGPALFDETSAGGGPADRAVVQEVIQEKLFSRVHQEVPYACAVLVDEMEREGNLLRVSATIIAERESHKPIVIGAGGSMLKAIGTEARRELEEILGCRVFLKLWVKVEKDWRDRGSVLTDLGYGD